MRSPWITPLAGEPAPRAETEVERTARLAHERTLLDEAREDVRAGRVIADGDVDAWLDRFVGGEPLPVPEAPSSSRAGQHRPTLALQRRLTIARGAARDLAEARRWLTQPGAGGRAARRLAALGAAIRDLREHPCRWSEGEHPGVRERHVEGHRVAYEVVPYR